MKLNNLIPLYNRNGIHFHAGLVGLLLLALLPLFSCSVTRKLPPNEKLYTGAKVKIDDKDTPAKKKKALTTELEGLVRPKPNTKLLGIPYKLMFYNMVDTVSRKKGLKNFIKNKLGEPPVLF